MINIIVYNTEDTHLLEESLGCLKVLDVLVQPRFRVVQCVSVVPKQQRVPHNKLREVWEVCLQQQTDVFLQVSQVIVLSLTIESVT